MPVQSIVELGSRPIVPKPFAGTNMIAELAAQIVVETALCKTCKELPRQSAKAIAARETPN